MDLADVFWFLGFALLVNTVIGVSWYLGTRLGDS